MSGVRWNMRRSWYDFGVVWHRLCMKVAGLAEYGSSAIESDLPSAEDGFELDGSASFVVMLLGCNKANQADLGVHEDDVGKPSLGDISACSPVVDHPAVSLIVVIHYVHLGATILCPRVVCTDGSGTPAQCSSFGFQCMPRAQADSNGGVW